MEYRTFLESLGVTRFPELGEAVYAEAMNEFDTYGCRWVREDFLLSIDAEMSHYEPYRDFILHTAAEIRADEALGRFTCLLAAVLRQNPKAVSSQTLALPQSPEGTDDVAFGMTGFFALMSQIPQSIEKLKAWKVPQDVIVDTFWNFLSAITNIAGYAHRPGFDVLRISWCIHYIIPDILKIGRLNFEIRNFGANCRLFRSKSGKNCILMTDGRFHRSGQALGSADCTDETGAFDADFRETDTFWEGVSPNAMGLIEKTRVRLDKSGWKQVLSSGDAVLSVHIPSGSPLSHTEVLDAYHRAAEIMANCRPDHKLRAFVCSSWLMEPMVGKLMEGKGNIAAFQRDFISYPLVSQGRAVYSFLFHMPNAQPDELPADSTLRRRVRDRLVSGKYIYELGAVLKPEVSGILPE